MANAKCIIILSVKSSGSSACQTFLKNTVGARHVDRSRHFENETLYWTKAASLLGLPQQPMLGSEVPIERKRARQDLVSLLTDNLPGYTVPSDDRELVFDGWRALCHHYQPAFLEKSPHHLFQWSALELILQAMQELNDVDFLLIGLVRNPMDTLYSAFQRWRIPPEALQYEWLTAYRNLQRLQSELGERLLVVRYEDMVARREWLRPVEAFCGVESSASYQGYLHRKSIQKWRQDAFYGFVPAEEVSVLAERYGYNRNDLANRPAKIWPLYRRWAAALHKGVKPAKRAAQSVRRMLAANG